MLRGASPEEENSAGYGAWEGFADTALLWLISITYSTSWLDQNLSKLFLKQLTVSAESTWFERLLHDIFNDFYCFTS